LTAGGRIFTRPAQDAIDSARMDLIALALGLIFFAAMLAVLEGIERV
jgi:hypothetical protein